MFQGGVVDPTDKVGDILDHHEVVAGGVSNPRTWRFATSWRA